MTAISPRHRRRRLRVVGGTEVVADGRPAPSPSPSLGATPQQRLAITVVGIVLVLVLLGSVMILSASSVVAAENAGSSFAVFLRQCVWMVIGGVALVVGARIDHRRLAHAVPLAVLGTLALLVLVLVPGVGIDVNGAQRWVGFGSARLQPAELAKLALVLFTAAVVARNHDRIGDHRRVLRPVVCVCLLYAALLMAQPNLGTTLVLAMIVGGMLLWAGMPLRVFVALTTVGAAAATAFALSAPYRRARLVGFLDPWENASTEGYQTIQSLIGVASGGVGGTGLGASRAKWGFLPEAHTDFVFSIIGEELGLIGGLVVIVLFAALVVVGLRIAERASDHFGAMVAVGITVWFAVQGFVNVGAVLNLLPVTGVPLPFVSFGGSSLLATMFAAGILVNIAIHGDAPGHAVRDRIASRRAANAARARSSPRSGPQPGPEPAR